MTAVRPSKDLIATPPVRIQLLHVQGCPNVDELCLRVKDITSRLGVSAVIDEIEALYPSPTLTVNGVDVTGNRVGSHPSCRLDLPTQDQIAAAISRAARVSIKGGAVPAPERQRPASNSSLQTEE